jgi:hypothetical protein
VCEERAPGTKYDRYFIEEFAKKIKQTEVIEEIVVRLKTLEGDTERFIEEMEAVRE